MNYNLHFPMPDCAVCGGPCESLEVADYLGDYLFTARCHGDVDYTVLSMDVVNEAIRTHKGVAFKQKGFGFGR